jgi:hypothetical protein
MLPGGHAVDWLAAGTYDRKVGLSLFTFQVTHKIEENTDVERDFVVSSVMAADPCVDVEIIRNFSTGYHTRNGGGDLIETDGDLPILSLRQVETPALAAETPTDSRDRRPAQTVFGSGVTLCRALVYLVLAVVVAVSADSFSSLALKVDVKVSEEEAGTLALTGAAVFLAAALVDGILAWFVLSGRNWARVWLMSICVFTTTAAFVSNVRGLESVSISHLPTVGIGVLVLLALSSHRARDYATGQREQPPA